MNRRDSAGNTRGWPAYFSAYGVKPEGKQGLPRGRPGPAQGDDAGNGRVHPPLHAPHPAGRLPPHPPLWAVRLHGARRQYRTAARVAGFGAAACAEGGKPQSRTAGRDGLAALSLPRQPHDPHRGLRARLAAPLPAAIRRRRLVRYIAIRCPLPRKTMLSSIASRGAGTMKLCLQSIPDSDPKNPVSPPLPVSEPASCHVLAPAAKNAPRCATAEAGRPLKSSWRFPCCPRFRSPGVFRRRPGRGRPARIHPAAI